MSGGHYGRGANWKDSPSSSPAINTASPVASAMTPSSGNKSPAGRIVSTILPTVSGETVTADHTTSAASAATAAQYLNNTDDLILSSHGNTRLKDRNGPIASPMSSSDSTGGGDSRLTTSSFKRLNGHGSSSSRRGAVERDAHRSSSTKAKAGLTKAGRNGGKRRSHIGRRRRRRSRSPGGRSDDNSASNSDSSRSRSGSLSGSSNSSPTASSRSSSSSGASRSRSSSPFISGRRNRQHKPTSSLVGTGAARSVPFEERTNCAICVRNLPARPSGKFDFSVFKYSVDEVQ